MREAVAEDAETIFRFAAGLIEDHLPGQTPWVSADDIKEKGFGTDPQFEAFITERNG